MRIYFTAAISTMDQFGKNYRAIVDVLEGMGHKVIADHILKGDLNSITKETQKEQEEYYKWMQKQISSADVLVAEVSFPSTVHVGHELTLALDKGKPVLALYIKERKPMLFWGTVSDKFYVAEYNLDDLKDILKNSLEDLANQMDVRFNFFISPKIGAYLDWVSRAKKTPRAVYLRKLIEEDMDGSGYVEKENKNNNKNKNKKKTE